MSKITNREYRAIAKRPGKRGFGMSDRRDRPEAPTIEEVLEETTKDLAETPAEELIRIAEEDLSELAVGEVRAYPFTEEGLAQVGRDFDRNSTVVGFDNGEDSNPAIEDLAVPVPSDPEPVGQHQPIGKIYEQPQSLGSIDGSRTVQETQ